ncbi:protein of unknown function [uncultured Woeseiaceae bacterium]|uniref:Uncharacterized protein n=1 Tax=uncultured Woeseiaceae bacterium TaxID=1983305 RepID=A0A7D9D2D4_9GAMM|nr:protein of unknown function [uncultured Woeseiaceae bacterium]
MNNHPKAQSRTNMRVSANSIVGDMNSLRVIQCLWQRGCVNAFAAEAAPTGVTVKRYRIYLK